MVKGENLHLMPPIDDHTRGKDPKAHPKMSNSTAKGRKIHPIVKTFNAYNTQTMKVPKATISNLPKKLYISVDHSAIVHRGKQFTRYFSAKTPARDLP